MTLASPATLVEAPALVDRFGRVHTDLRVSVTDRCPLRCTYCVPASGSTPLPRTSSLTADEIVRAVRVAVAHGVTKVRLTGGEPLVRPDLELLVQRLAALRPRPELCLTTSGIGLADRAQLLFDAGLDRVTVSLDTLDPDEYTRLTGRDALHDVLAGIAALPRASTKVNAVMVRGLTEHAGPHLVDWALANDLELRFIEQMPLGGSPWHRSDMLTADELLTVLRTGHRLTETPDDTGAPARRYRVDDGPAHVGIIAAVTRPFCGDCSRLRLTADGQLRSCLFATDELDLRTVLRSGADDTEVADTLARCVAGKSAGHGIGHEGFRPPVRLMRAIGG
ncbi:MAG: GTP 3',8-cyclase MoaA [Micrococcales bacterium]|nr:GTP 3',8-cyclase MoaA [Micrococcales bacterium]